MQLLNFVLFFFLVFLIIYLPGRLILRLSGYKFVSFLITFSSSLIIGLSAFLFCTYILSWIKIPYIYSLIIPFVLFLEYKSSFLEFKKNIKIQKSLIPEILLIILGTVAMAFTTWNSGTYKNGEILFYGINGRDSVYHLALIGSLISNFPPFHPGLAGIPLKGYNFFYDFLIANFAQFYHFNPLDLFFRYFSLFISLILGFSSLSLAKFLKWKKITALLFIFLMYFIQNFDYFAHYLYKLFNYNYYSAGITQSLANALDPSIVISTSFIFIGFILLFSKGKQWSFLLSVLVIGVIPQIKIYSGIIFYLGLSSVALWELYRNRNVYYLKILIFSGLLSAVVYLPINSGAGGLVFGPLLIYKNFIDSAWIFKSWNWNVNYITYVQHNNYFHLGFFYFVAITSYLITSLGVRLIILLDFKKITDKKFYTGGNIFWLTSILGSFLIPSFFIQSISAFSVVQFFWVGYIILLIPTAAVLGKKLEKASKITLTVTFLFLFFLFLPDTAGIIKLYAYNPWSISADIVKQTNIISRIPQGKGVIVVNRVEEKGEYADIFGTPVISALSAHPIYYENELTAFHGIDKTVNLRKENVDKIIKNMVNCNNPIAAEGNIVNIMRESNNSYLLILKQNSCSKNFNKLETVKKEGESVLYKI